MILASTAEEEHKAELARNAADDLGDSPLAAVEGETHGTDFADFLAEHHEPVAVVFRLAEQESVVLLHGGGFRGPAWSVRVSLANLGDDSYERIGAAIARVAGQYVAEFEAAGGVTRPEPR